MQWLTTVTYSVCVFIVQANDVLSNAVWLFLAWEKQVDILLWECIEVSRCSDQSGSRASSLFETPSTCVLTTQSTKYHPHSKTEKIIFDYKILWSARQQIFLQVQYSLIFLGNVILNCKFLSLKRVYITHYKPGVHKFSRNLWAIPKF